MKVVLRNDAEVESCADVSQCLKISKPRTAIIKGSKSFTTLSLVAVYRRQLQTEEGSYKRSSCCLYGTPQSAVLNGQLEVTLTDIPCGTLIKGSVKLRKGLSL
ncbi:hypothetical protein HS7_02810 [Sulfolobales archaeon HS-7]|nr:hypothetical protein HS7_02810 [Sulfolobales archaeon HS-7]